MGWEIGIHDEILRKGGEIVLLQGYVATGKTAVLHELAERAAAQGAVVLHATGAWTEAEFQFGVIRQLLAAALPPDRSDDVAILLDDGVLSATLCEPDAKQQPAARVMEMLWTELLTLSGRKPLVIMVDDIHLADTSSIECILYFARRLRSTSVSMVLAQDRRPWGRNQLLQAELARLPNCRTADLRQLTQDEVAALVSRHQDVHQPDRLAVAVHRASGGNPLLAQALIADYLDCPWKAEGELVTGDAFHRAVQSCLSRCDAGVLRLAQALAVLNVPAVTATLGLMLGLPEASVAGMLPELAGIGLISAGRFRDPAIRATVLGMMPPGDLAVLHVRAARALHEEHAVPRTVAEHLIAADGDAAWTREPWMSAVLSEAADRAMGDQDPAFAARCLRLAMPLARAPGERAEFLSGIAAARWLADPGAASGYLPELGEAVRRGHLREPSAARVVHHQLWAGLTREAIATLATACRGQPDAELRSELLAARLWVSRMCPGAVRPTDPAPVMAARHATNPSMQAARLVEAVVGGEFADAAIAGHEPRVASMDDTALAMAGAAMAAAICSGESEAIKLWSDAFLDQAGSRHASRRSPTCRALLAAIRGAIHLRLGNLRAARAQAREAVVQITPKSWGVLIGIPAAVLVLATAAAGCLDEAAGYVSMPVPEPMFGTILGPVYLLARGHYYLAAGKPALAYRDFETCGETVRQWQVDNPGFAAWRIGAAEACLRQGSGTAARELLAEHISLAGADRGRVYGAWLRVQAAASPLRERPFLLHDAVEAVRASGDRIEEVRAFADLGQVYEELGKRGEANRMRRKALHLARQYGADQMGLSGKDKKEDAQAPDDGSGLSEAERRVAALAARGYSNREIASLLYVTVSTVEQHLTHAYRKLNVRRRADLPSLLAHWAPG